MNMFSERGVGGAMAGLGLDWRRCKMQGRARRKRGGGDW
jgi:hypothetical protein